MRGDIHRLRNARSPKGHEQQGRRFGVIIQSDDLFLSTLLVAPTSRSTRRSSFRAAIEIENEDTLVLLEQTTAVAPDRLGDFVGCVTADELHAIDAALLMVLGLE